MKRILFAIGSLSILVAMAFPAQRIVVAEDFTATWCQYCPSAARGLDQLYIEAGDSLVVIAYHPDNDPGADTFSTAESEVREVYYKSGIPGYGYPTVIFDGTDVEVGGLTSPASMYSYYRPHFNSHKTVSSPFEMRMAFVSYDIPSRTGSVQVTVKNVSGGTESGVRHFVIIERGIPWNWEGGLTEVDFCERTMLPSGSGRSFSLAAGDSLVDTMDFTIPNTIPNKWNIKNCQFVSFVQRSNKQIIQAAKLMTPSLVQQQYALEEYNGNGNGYYEPNENIRLTVWVKNKWEEGNSARVQLETADPYVQITNGLFDIGDMAEGDSADNSAQPFEILVDPSATMPEGHLVAVAVLKKIYCPAINDTVVNTDTVSFLVGSPGVFFSEDFETGLDGWGKGYIGTAHPDTVLWDTTSLEAHSGLYCITDSRDGDYRNTSNNYIFMTSGLDLRGYSTATLQWWDKYVVDAADNCRVQFSTNGGANWATHLQQKGTQGQWTLKSLDLRSYCGTIADFRIRFMLSANASITADGWYVDDVAIMGYTNTGVASRPEPAQRASRTALTVSAAFPNPTSGQTIVEYQIEQEQRVVLNVYDITGRLVRTLAEGRQLPGRHQAVWNGTDHGGSKVANGIYFVRVEAGGSQGIQKVVFIR